ncbi:MAG TPA: hypothetical protein VG738_12860 [Chitinophagaceae bacterium]|nr:hypothetical protein [Chitinophagaceae bacterium]
MVNRAQLAFKWLPAVFAAVLLFSPGVQQPIRTVNSNDALLSSIGNTWYYNGTLFNGEIYALYNNGDTMLTEKLKNGLLTGIMKRWYPDRQLHQITMYNKGMRQGVQYSWWPGGQIKSMYNYKDDRLNGPAKEWYAGGGAYREMNYKMGYENGLQRMWNVIGVITANYEMRDGRKYGLTGVRKCENTVDDDPAKLFTKK